MVTSRGVERGLPGPAQITLACLLVLAVLVSVIGFARADQSGDAEGPEVFATTGFIADAVHNIAPEAEVTTLVGPGGDPHHYQPSTKQIQKMLGSDVVLWNGLYLEAQMVDQLQGLGEKQMAVADAIPREELIANAEEPASGAGGLDRDNATAAYDPHIWNSPSLWRQTIEPIADRLAELHPDKAEGYATNAREYIRHIDDAARQGRDEVTGIPVEDRVLVTGHDAFGYLGRDLDIDVHATDFIAADAQVSANQLSGLADMIVDERIRTIFLDNQSNPQAISSLREAVQARGGMVSISPDALYADSLGTEAEMTTYTGAYRHNVDAIAGAMRQTHDEKRAGE